MGSKLFLSVITFSRNRKVITEIVIKVENNILIVRDKVFKIEETRKDRRVEQ